MIWSRLTTDAVWENAMDKLEIALARGGVMKVDDCCCRGSEEVWTGTKRSLWEIPDLLYCTTLTILLVMKVSF